MRRKVLETLSLKKIDKGGLLKKELITAEEIQDKVDEIARQISKDYADSTPVLIGILRGAFIFLSDLARRMTIPVVVDFMAVSSYGKSTQTSGVVRIVKDLDEDIEGKDVIIVEDILDTGLTVQYLLETLKARNPKSIEVCTLLLKEGKQKVELNPKYVGFIIPDEFVVGYGLDYADMFRQLPSIYSIDVQKLK
jgi:hypoxanthine phosphoribosyltransferase